MIGKSVKFFQRMLHNIALIILFPSHSSLELHFLSVCWRSIMPSLKKFKIWIKSCFVLVIYFICGRVKNMHADLNQSVEKYLLTQLLERTHLKPTEQLFPILAKAVLFRMYHKMERSWKKWWVLETLILLPWTSLHFRYITSIGSRTALVIPVRQYIEQHITKIEKSQEQNENKRHPSNWKGKVGGLYSTFRLNVVHLCSTKNIPLWQASSVGRV